MSDAIDDLLANPDILRTDPPPPELIEEVEAWYGVPLPDELVRLWSYSNGFALEMIGGDILGPSEVLKFASVPIGDWMVDRGFLPLVYDRQSNYFGLMVREPLSPRVTYLSHDEGIPALRYRDLESCLLALLDAIDADRLVSALIDETPGDFPPIPTRPVEDQIAARDLLATDGAREEWYYAIQLLDETNFNAWQKLLETETGLRSRVRARMSVMESAEIQDMLREDAEALAAFGAEVIEALGKAGITVDGADASHIHIGERSWNLEFFFYRRHIPDAMARIVLWITDQLAGRNPHDRPGHYMSD